jgi:hypothetical protein
MSIDSVSIEYNLVYQASATFAQPLTPGGILMIMGLSPPVRVDASVVDVGSTVMVWVVMAVSVTSTRGKTF